METRAIVRGVRLSVDKGRLVADLIRGENVDKALGILRYSTRHASRDLEKLLMSAVANWEAKNEGRKADEAGLVVKSVQVNEAGSIKRMLPAPQGRAYRMRKRSNHVSIIVDTKPAPAAN